MVWNIQSRSAVGPLAIGMTVIEFRQILGREDKTFKRLPDAEDIIYVYNLESLHLTCNNGGMVKIISVFRPKVVCYSGISLLGREIDEVVAELVSKGITVEKEDAGYWVAAAGVLLVDVDGITDGLELYPD